MDEALAAGHEVVAFVRNPAAVVPRAGVTVIGGSIEDEVAMRAAFEGADAVISCLGARMTPGMMFSGTDFQQQTLPKIIAAINAAGVKRFVLMSSLGVGATAAKQSFIPRFLFSGIIAKKLFDDKDVAERALPGCAANWTTVYPVGLKAGPVDAGWDLVPLGKVRSVPGIPMLAFATVAKVLVALAPDQAQGGEKLLLTTTGGWR
jgi:uncharacterized protein YbjT (DUF2867 family)